MLQNKHAFWCFLFSLAIAAIWGTVTMSDSALCPTCGSELVSFDGRPFCTACNQAWVWKDGNLVHPPKHYCPRCGARLKGFSKQIYVCPQKDCLRAFRLENDKLSECDFPEATPRPTNRN